MNTSTIVSTIFGLVMTGFNIWLTTRVNRNAKDAPYGQRQHELRAELRGRLNSQWRLARAVGVSIDVSPEARWRLILRNSRTI